MTKELDVFSAAERKLLKDAGIEQLEDLVWIQAVKVASTEWRRARTAESSKDLLLAHDLTSLHLMMLRDLKMAGAAHPTTTRMISKLWPATGRALLELKSAPQEDNMRWIVSGIQREYIEATSHGPDARKMCIVLSKVLNIAHGGGPNIIERYVAGFPLVKISNNERYSQDEISSSEFLGRLNDLGRSPDERNFSLYKA